MDEFSHTYDDVMAHTHTHTHTQMIETDDSNVGLRRHGTVFPIEIVEHCVNSVPISGLPCVLR